MKSVIPNYYPMKHPPLLAWTKWSIIMGVLSDLRKQARRECLAINKQRKSAIAILALVVMAYQNMWAVHIEVHSGPRHYIVDLVGQWNENETYLLEYQSTHSGQWTFAGIFERTQDINTFFLKYKTWYAASPELRWLPFNEEALIEYFEKTKSMASIEELEPIRDRVYYSALGYSIIIPKSTKPVIGQWRIKNKNGHVVQTMSAQYTQNIQWPDLVLRDYRVEDIYPSISWQAMWDFNTKIQGFKVYRAIEFSDAFAEVENITKILSLNIDTLICIVRDTSTQLAGYYQYYITLTDIAGNESQPSPVVRMPNMGQYPEPVFTYFKVKKSENERANTLHWKIGHAERLYYLEVWRSAPGVDEWSLVKALPPSDTTFVDYIDMANEAYEYKVICGDMLLDAPIESAVSFGLTSVADFVFARTYIKVESNEDGVEIRAQIKDIKNAKGLYVVRGESYDPEFQIVSPWIDITADSLEIAWIDTNITSLKPETPYGYSLMLVDDTYQKHYIKDTAFIFPNTAIELPQPYVFVKEILEDGSGRFAWRIQDFEEYSVREFRVYSSKNGNQFDQTKYKTISPENNMLKVPIGDRDLTYSVAAVHWMGKVGPRSESIRFTTPKHPMNSEAMELWSFNTTNGVQLQWPKFDKSMFSGVELYRQMENEASPRKIDFVGWTLSEYVDITIKKGENATYFITPILPDGSRGVSSTDLFVQR